MNVKKAIQDIKFMSQTHVHWAEYFEKNPDIEKEYVSTGEWDTAKEHRNIISKYDNVLEILNEVNLKRNASEADEV